MIEARHHNSFGALRWLFALSVVYCHSFDLVGNYGHGDWIAKVSGYRLSHLGVVGFFILSGYLNSGSLQNATGNAVGISFLTRRAFRIFPLLWLVVTVGVLASFIASGLTKPVISGGMRFLMGNGLLYQIHYSLPGLFTHNINTGYCGSIWTLPYEILLYLVLVVTGMARRGDTEWKTKAILAGLLCAMCATHSQDERPFCASLQHFWLGHLGWAFLCGTLLARMPGLLLSRKVAIGMGVFLIGSVFLPGSNFPGWQFLQVMAYAVIVIKAGSVSWGPVARWANGWDASYGIYLMSFPIQQMLIAAGWTHAYSLFFMAAAISAIAGLVSWKLLEQPMLHVGKRLGSLIQASPENGGRNA